MWIPKSEEEIKQVVETGSLEETATFDAKREISSKSQEIAKDIAAMANDGGVIIYGISEDKDNRLTELTPVNLIGVKERITSIVQTCITEPPTISIFTIPIKDDASIGYVVVTIPPSERAPHMVIVKGENRYYGRNGATNVVLNEGEVARLYARRDTWEIDRDKLLSKQIETHKVKAVEGFAYLYLFIRPVSQIENLIDKSIRNGETVLGALTDLVREVSDQSLHPRTYSPDFQNLYYYPVQRVNGYLWKPNSSQDIISPRDILELEVFNDGSGKLFCGRAADKFEEKFYFYPELVIGNFYRFLSLFSKIYERAGYLGMIDVGIGITGLKGCILDNGNGRRNLPKYDENEYRQSKRLAAISLTENAMAITKSMVMPLIGAISQSLYDPFK